MFRVDDIVKDLLDTLTSAEVLEDMYILFSSDNGYVLGQLWRPEEKYNVYENDIRVPMLERGPNVPKGVLFFDAMMAMVDLTAIIVELPPGGIVELPPGPLSVGCNPREYKDCVEPG